MGVRDSDLDFPQTHNRFTDLPHRCTRRCSACTTFPVSSDLAVFLSSRGVARISRYSGDGCGSAPDSIPPGFCTLNSHSRRFITAARTLLVCRSWTFPCFQHLHCWFGSTSRTLGSHSDLSLPHTEWVTTNLASLGQQTAS